MAESLSYVIVGNGIAGVTAAETVRQEQPAAEITIIADTPAAACYRPVFKDYMAGRVSEEALFARRPGFYADKDLRFLLDRVVAIDVAQHQLVLRRGQSMGYDRLLLATGARARRLTCPGSDLAGVLTLHSSTDYQAALRFLEIARRVVVYGGGPLALETVETLRQRGMTVTHLLRRRQLWPDMLDRTASELVLHQEEETGVEVRVEDEISEITGRQGRVVGLITRGGARIPCDLLITAIGSEPVIDFIATSSIACERGVTVDHAMRTSAADVYAAGDVAETLDPLTGRMRVTGQWYPAMQQGRAAAYSMLGMLDVLRLRHTAAFSSAYLRPINTSSLFGFDIAAIGLTSATTPACQEVVADVKTHIYSKVVLKNGVPVGMLSFDSRRDMLAIKRAIDHGVDLTEVASCLFDRDFKLQTWLDARRVPAPVLAVRKARTNVAQLVTTTPARNFRSQFAPAAPLPPLVDENEDSGRTLEMKLPASNNPYNLHIIPSAAFLAPVMPARTAQTLVNSDDTDHMPTILLNEQDPDRTVAPAHTHTPISQAESLTIGREASSKLVINHQSISRRHAAITCASGTYLLRDLGSRNGTFINETRLSPDRDYPLKPRDYIRIGNLMTYQFLVKPVAPGT